MTGLLVDLDRGLMKHNAFFLDLGIASQQVGPTCTQRFYLGPEQGDAGLKSFKDLKIPVRLPVGDNVRAHHESQCSCGRTTAAVRRKPC